MDIKLMTAAMASLVLASGTAFGDFDSGVLYDTGYIPTSGDWTDGTNKTTLAWGWNAAVPVAGDYDGDGYGDFGVYAGCDGKWYIRFADTNSTGAAGTVGYDIVDWGWSDTVPVPYDYDNDGLTDIAVYNPGDGTWFIRYADTNVVSEGYTIVQWGWRDSVPVMGDYDGDGFADYAVFYKGVWYIRFSNLSAKHANTFEIAEFGWDGVLPVPADLDWNGTTDFVVYDKNGKAWYMYVTDGEDDTGAKIDAGWKNPFKTYQWGWTGALPFADAANDGWLELFDPKAGTLSATRLGETTAGGIYAESYLPDTLMTKGAVPAVNPQVTVLRWFGLWK